MSALSLQNSVIRSPRVNLGENEVFYRDVINGLGKIQKQISPKYFYDDEGSHLFDAICDLSEYYPYRTELKLLDTVAADLSSRFRQPCLLVEFGAGSLRKVERLLTHLKEIQCFIPIDISGPHLTSACKTLQNRHSRLSIRPLVADFSKRVDIEHEGQQCLGFFPGSTIGNFSPEEARQFLLNARYSLGEGSHLLVGVDTKKSPDIIHRAYNDAAGVTARFNRNLLQRINRELDGNFRLESFGHYACYNPFLGRVEMHLISLSDQVVQVADQAFLFRQGESIHTENSYKYTCTEFCRLAEKGGWQVEQVWLADENLFAIYLLSHH